MKNRVIHFDISATDPEKVAQFYRDVFGWEIKKWESEGPMEYWLITTGKEGEPGINGGLSKRTSEVGDIKTFVDTISVVDIDESLEKIIQAGGTIEMDKSNLPGVGIFASVKDPDGNVFNLMQEDENMGKM